ncbi:hypothetical protein CBR_g50929 [Chara braunii]|uniref:nucleoside-diphosphate kinase n=1 Tax=Chara braunii TaxID=69332 RepID=A0A388M7S5_CHABU|nr:hypothetical protein CBR_g50929 [Chara braunii]|eukprot:GBG90586.1 hypothetical protein CBR_g50929 [Chara braunii]
MAACALSGCHVGNAAVSSSSSSYGVRTRSSSCQENSVVVTANVAGIAVPGASSHAPLRADDGAGRRRWSVGFGLSYGASLAGTRLREDNIASCRYLNARWKSIGRLTCQAQAGEGSSERTFVMVKPDGVQRGLVGDIVGRFERKGFTLKALKLFQCPKSLAEIWEGKGVVASARKLIGVTNPLEADPGTIRGDFAVEVGR